VHWPNFISGETLECCAVDLTPTQNLLTADKDQHFLLTTINMAFNKHSPLTLSPDDFLLPLVQAAAVFIDEKLTNKIPVLNITPGKEKVKLIVRRDDFALGQENPWHEIFQTFGQMIKQDIGQDNYEMLRGDFTTTQIYQAASYDVSLMSACKSHYEYHNMFMCGIPEIHLLGTNEDWQKLKSKALKIAELIQINGWQQALSETIDKIIKSREDPSKENLSFWCDLYRRGHHSGGEHINGWINLFFPYIRSHSELTLAKSAEHMKGKGMFGGRNVSSYSSSLSWAPVHCNDRGNQVLLSYYAGQVGVKWDSTQCTISPAWGWCISINKR